MKKRTLALMLSAALCVGMLAGCGGGTTTTTESPVANTESQAPESESPAAEQITGTVNTNGSTSMESVIGILSEQFMADNQGVTVTYDATGSGTGIESVSNGSCDIGLASRALEQSEIDSGLVATEVALDGIAIIVNADSPVADRRADRLHLHW